MIFFFFDRTLTLGCSMDISKTSSFEKKQVKSSQELSYKVFCAEEIFKIILSFTDEKLSFCCGKFLSMTPLYKIIRTPFMKNIICVKPGHEPTVHSLQKSISMIKPIDLLVSIPNTDAIFDKLIEHIIIVFDKSMSMRNNMAMQLIGIMNLILHANEDAILSFIGFSREIETFYSFVCAKCIIREIMMNEHRLFRFTSPGDTCPIRVYTNEKIAKINKIIETGFSRDIFELKDSDNKLIVYTFFDSSEVQKLKENFQINSIEIKVKILNGETYSDLQHDIGPLGGSTYLNNVIYTSQNFVDPMAQKVTFIVTTDGIDNGFISVEDAIRNFIRTMKIPVRPFLILMGQSAQSQGLENVCHTVPVPDPSSINMLAKLLLETPYPGVLQATIKNINAYMVLNATEYPFEVSKLPPPLSNLTDKYESRPFKLNPCFKKVNPEEERRCDQRLLSLINEYYETLSTKNRYSKEFEEKKEIFDKLLEIFRTICEIPAELKTAALNACAYIDSLKNMLNNIETSLKDILSNYEEAMLYKKKYSTQAKKYKEMKLYEHLNPHSFQKK